MEEFIFRYNGDMANVVEEHDEDGMTYHELLLQENGMRCRVYFEEWDSPEKGSAYFDDGNELTVYRTELEEI